MPPLLNELFNETCPHVDTDEASTRLAPFDSSYSKFVTTDNLNRPSATAAGKRLHCKAIERRERLDGLVAAAEAEKNKDKPELHLVAMPRGRVLTRSLSPQSASQRLYETATMMRKRLEEAKEKASYEPEHRLVFETKNYRRRSESPSSRLGVPRYEVMYSRAKVKERSKSASSFELESPRVTLLPDPSPDARCNKLYSVWTEKNKKGKELRENIERSKLPPERPKHWDEKITLEEAIKIYERGMMKKINLEMKRLAANPTHQEYNSPLLKAVANEDMMS